MVAEIDGVVTRRDDAMAMDTMWPAPAQKPALDALFAWLIEYRSGGGHVRTTPERLALMRRYFDDTSREQLLRAVKLVA